jgi:hypothetical protein
VDKAVRISKSHLTGVPIRDVSAASTIRWHSSSLKTWTERRATLGGSVENLLVESRWQDKIMEMADDGRQLEVTWEISDKSDDRSDPANHEQQRQKNLSANLNSALIC